MTVLGLIYVYISSRYLSCVIIYLRRLCVRILFMRMLCIRFRMLPSSVKHATTTLPSPQLQSTEPHRHTLSPPQLHITPTRHVHNRHNAQWPPVTWFRLAIHHDTWFPQSPNYSGLRGGRTARSFRRLPVLRECFRELCLEHMHTFVSSVMLLTTSVQDTHVYIICIHFIS